MFVDHTFPVFPTFSSNKCSWRLRAFSSHGRRTCEPRIALPLKDRLRHYGIEYNLVVVDSDSTWVEVVATPHNDAKTVVKFLEKNIFSRFGVPRILINNGGTHFCNNQLHKVLKQYNFTPSNKYPKSIYLTQKMCCLSLTLYQDSKTKHMPFTISAKTKNNRHLKNKTP